MHLLRAIVLVTVITAGNFSALQRRARNSYHWSYGDNGQEDWDGLCRSGRRQSPIDLSGPTKPILALPLMLEGVYKKKTKLQSSWNGHAYSAQFTNRNKLGVLAGGALKDVYIFQSLHFHSGSEHTFNNKRYSGEMHLVHMNSKYSPEEAATKKDGFAVLGVLVKETNNPKSHQMSDFLEALTHESGASFEANIHDTLPKDLQQWIAYHGSLTTPGCSENVKWTVLKEIVEIRRGIVRG